MTGTVQGGEAVIAGVDLHFLESKHVGDEFKIFVARSSPSDEKADGVLFLGDAVVQFGTATEITRLLCLAQYLPPLLLVGIGYRASYLPETTDRRMRDFAPTPCAKFDGKGGGAAAFLEFIDEELKPFIANTYGVGTDDATFAGYSLGGLFGAWVLLTRPSAFRRYALGSPSLWWDEHAVFTVEADYAASHEDLDARVFVSVGGFEDQAGSLHAIKWLPEDKRAAAYEEAEKDPTDMVADARAMVETLRGRSYPSLELDFQVLDGEFHATSGPLALSRALRYLYDAPR